MNNAKVLIKFEGDTKDFDSKAKKVNVSMGSVAKGVLAATGITKALSAAWNMVSNSMDGAISRLDTMNNFPKVMSNLGIGAEESQKAIDTLSDRLTGLPTSLDSAAMSVQRLTSKNGDIKKSTDLFLAMNNAILAGGASSEIQSSAIEQLSQAYAKGKPDMMEWRTLMTAMPAQLKQVASAMGYVSADALGESLRDGSVSMDQFMEKIVEMNQTGVNGFKSFDEQARNATGGIATSITNMRTAVTRGVANVVNSLDKGLKDAGLGGLSQVISNIGKTMENVLKQVASGLQKIIPKIVAVIKWIQKNQDVIKQLILSVGTMIVVFGGIMKIISIVKTFGMAMQGLFMIMAANPIVLLIALIAGIVVAIIYAWNHCEKFRNFFINMWDGIKKTFNTVIDFIKKNWKGIALFIVNPFAGAFKLLYDNSEKFREKVNGFILAIKTKITEIVDFIKGIPEKVQTFIQQVIDFISNLPYYIGYAIGWMIGKIYKFFTQDIPNAYNAVKEWASSLPEKIKEFLSNIWLKISAWFTSTKENISTKAQEIINNIVAWFKSLPDRIVATFNNLSARLKAWFTTTKTNAKTKSKNLINDIVTWFKELPGRMKEIGKNIIDGVWQGIQNKAAAFKQKVKSFFKGIVNGVKDALGIHSPSKEFAIIAKFSVLGYTEQLDKMKKQVESQVADTFSLSPQVANSAALNYNPNVVVNNQISMKQDPLGQMVSNIKTFSGGAKNDYNYGASY